MRPAIVRGMEKEADWKAIVNIAVETDAKLGRQCREPGRIRRTIYWRS